MKLSKLLGILIMVTFACCLSGCGSDGADSGTGTLSVNLTDAPGEYKAVYVTIDEVQVHKGDEDGEQDGGGGWITVASPEKTYNLLDLTDGVMENLGIAVLDQGRYTQIRLYLGDEPRFPDGEPEYPDDNGYANYLAIEGESFGEVADIVFDTYELKIPSGYQSGIKIVNEFTIEENQMVELLLDFNAATSVVKAGDSGQYILKPTIKIKTIETHDYFLLSGTVKDQDDESLLDHAIVSAYEYSDGEYVYYDSTFTNETGNYMMYLKPGTYKIVASNPPDYSPSCGDGVDIVAELEGDETKDFDLNPATDTGAVSGLVTITGGEGTETATLSFRQVVCGVEIEVDAFTDLATGSTYTSDVLPADDYTIVATVDETEVLTPVTVPTAGAVDIVIPLP